MPHPLWAICLGTAAAQTIPELPAQEVAEEHVWLRLAAFPDIRTGGDHPLVVHHVAGALAANGSDELEGVQFTLGANVVVGRGVGVQASLGADVVGASFDGIQATVGCNVVGARLRGIQAAVGCNVAREATGVQTSVGPSVADRVEGLQVALVNVGAHVSGAQIGLVNVAGRVDGAQIGLVNVADDADQPLGLVSVNGTGYNSLRIGGGDAGPRVGLTYGGARFYSLFELGVAPAFSELPLWLGFGWHEPHGPWYVDTDLSAGSRATWGPTAVPEDDLLMVKLRPAVGVRVVPPISAWAAAVLTVYPIGEPEPWTAFPAIPTEGLPASLGLEVGIRIGGD